MTTGQQGLDLIKQFESLYLTSYRDPVGIWTIGWGTTKINNQQVPPGLTITEDEAEQYLQNDLANTEWYVNNYVTVGLTQQQFDALVSFTYNLGPNNLRNSTLLRLLNSGDYAGAANEFPKWDMAGGHVLQGLLNRRLAEQQLFLS
jgi:lysozyme